jgi:Secretion system C-terminal sorting domain
MKKLLLSFLLVTGLNSTAQVTVFEDSFETYNNFIITGIGDWQTLDLDLLNTYTGGLPTGINPNWPNASAPQAYQIFNPSTTTPQVVTNSTDACNTGAGTENRNFDPKTGAKYAACWAGVPSTTGGATANNDWLVSPVLNLGTSNNELRFWVKSLSSCYGLEKYRVGVYVGTGTPTLTTDFALISGVPALTAPVTWEEKIFSLNAYSNQSIRIGIRCTTADAYMLMVDDFLVTSSNLKVDDFFSNKFSAYPNPANSIVTLSNTDNLLVTAVSISDINGRTVKNMDVNNLSEVELNVSELTSGVYFMNVTTDSGKAVKKFIKN